MSNITTTTNTPDMTEKPTPSSPDGEKTRRLSAWFTPAHCLNGLLLATVIQLVLCILLYVLAAVQFKILLIEAVAMLALGWLAHKQGDVFRWRVTLRVVFITLISLLLAGGAVMIILLAVQSGDASGEQLTQTILPNLWMTVALLVLPALLFLQPAMAVLAHHRYRFDLVLQRIIALAVLALSLLLCLFALDYSLGGSPLIVSSVSFSPVVFDYPISITINIDNVLTRILFCLCSAAAVVFAFKLPSLPRKKPSRKTKTGSTKKARA